jgi:hypothetical protein
LFIADDVDDTVSYRFSLVHLFIIFLLGRWLFLFAFRSLLSCLIGDTVSYRLFCFDVEMAVQPRSMDSFTRSLICFNVI